MLHLIYENEICLSVCPSVTLVDGNHTLQIVQQKVEINMAGQVSILATCMPKPIQIIVPCDSGMQECGALHYSGVQRLACSAISAYAKFLVLDWYLKRTTLR